MLYYYDYTKVREVSELKFVIAASVPKCPQAI